jgi:hypothetical protein
MEDIASHSISGARGQGSLNVSGTRPVVLNISDRPNVGQDDADDLLTDVY